MRPILVLPVFLFLAGCATQQPPTPAPVQAQPASERARSQIIGLTAEDLVQRFGLPALQIREGDSWKLQFRSKVCVLDAYLYPPAPARTPVQVTFVDTRTPSLAAIDQAICISSLERR